jgi:class 3 adenylate cyclase
VTFLFSDIEGSTDLSRQHGAAHDDLRAEHRWIVRQAREAAEPAQLLVSSSTHALLEGEVLGELGPRDLGEREVPGMTPTRVYELVTE